MRNNKRIYQKVMRNISNEIKRILDENIQNFDVTDYSDDETDIIDRHELDKYVYKYFPKNKAELKFIIEQRIEENPEYPYLLDICTIDITDMSKLFEDCNTIKKLDLNSWDTSNVVNMGAMFVNCTFLKEIKINNNRFNTSNVISMNSMFFGCKSLESLNLNSWDVSKCENMTGLFNNCESLEELDLSSWDVSNVKYIGIIFARCLKLQTLDLSGWDISSALNTYGMFIDTNSLKLVYASDEKIIDYLEFHHHNSFCGLTIISKELNEDVQNFDITDYSEDDDTLIDQDTVTKMTCYPFTVFLHVKQCPFNVLDTDDKGMKDAIVEQYGFEPDDVIIDEMTLEKYKILHNFPIEYVYIITIRDRNSLKNLIRFISEKWYTIIGERYDKKLKAILSEDCDYYDYSIEKYLRNGLGIQTSDSVDKFVNAVKVENLTFENCGVELDENLSFNKSIYENKYNFDALEYQDDDIIDHDTVTKMTCYPFTVCFKAYRNITIEEDTDTDCIKEQILRLFKFKPEGIHVYYNPNYGSFNNYYKHIYKIRIYNQNMLKEFLRLMENFSFCIQGSTRVFTSILAEDDGYDDSIEEYLRSEKGGTPDSEIDKFIEAVENSGITIEDCMKNKR